MAPITSPSDNPMVRQVIDRLHVSASSDEVCDAMRRATLAKWRKAHPTEWQELCDDALEHHAHNQNVYNQVIRGW